MPSLKARIRHLARNGALTVHDCERVCKALEKQEKKTPVMNQDRPYACPTCGSEYGIRTDDWGDKPKCCSECGQYLDWKDDICKCGR